MKKETNGGTCKITPNWLLKFMLPMNQSHWLLKFKLPMNQSHWLLKFMLPMNQSHLSTCKSQRQLDWQPWNWSKE